jgi:penicillin-binding protein 1B
VPKNIKNQQTSIKFSIFRFLFWFTPGLIVGVFFPWYFYLNSLIDELFVEFNWSIPASVYARELNLFAGKTISKNELIFELQALGYKHKDRMNQIGDYALNGDDLAIYTKGYKFYDKAEPPQKLYLTVSQNKVVKINTSIARLEPLLIGNFYSSGYQNRMPISIKNIPNTMVTGLQAVEDRSFKQHQGVDLFGIARALIKNLFAGKVVQGGSTITQQLIKNRFNYSQNSWLRKANEAVAAIMLEHKFDKGQIIESYFNEIYWGQHGKIAIHGVQQASLYYFSKVPKQLSISEQALLIGIVKGPSWYHPIKQKGRSKQRRDTVLKVWLDTGVISLSQYNTAISTDLSVKINNSFASHQYTDFLDLVKNQLAKSFSTKQLKQQGIQIYTTLNPFIQNSLSAVLTSETDKLGNQLQSSAVISDSQTGDLLAIKGSKDDTTYFNRAILSKRQIGSLIKPFVYLANLEMFSDFSMQDKVSDAQLTIKTESGESWTPSNYDKTSLGSISADEALYKSRNQATVALGMRIGVSRFVKFLEQIGLNINHSNHPSIFLGSTELTPLEVTNLYLLLSSEHQNNQLFAINYITDKNNKLIGKLKHNSRLRFAKNSLAQVNSSLNKVTTLGTAAKLTYKFAFKQPLFGKTGTTNDGRNSWFVGYDDKYLATFWVGKDNNTATNLTGSSGALELWAQWYLRLN